MIDDATAQLFLQHLDTAAPAQRDDMLTALQEYRDGSQQQQQQQADAVKVRQFYSDPVTLGGNWTKPMQDALGQFQTNPQQDRAAWANVGFLALVNGKPREQVAPNYEQYRQQYAASNFNNGTLDDLGFYNAVKGQYDAAENQRTLSDSLKSDATNAAFTQAVTGGTPDYFTAFDAWSKAHESKPGFDAGQGDDYLAQYRAEHRAAFDLANENRDLFTVARDLLVKQTDRQGTDATPANDNQTGSALEEAANRLSAATPDERQAVFQMIGSWAKSNYPEDPSGAISRIGEFFRQEAQSVGRGFDAFKTMPANVQESALTSLRDALKSGQPLRSGVGFGLLGSHDLTPEERAAMLPQLDKALSFISISRELNALAKEKVDPIRPVLVPQGIPYVSSVAKHTENAAYGFGEFAPTMAAGMLPVVGTPAMMAAMGNQEYDRLRLEGITPEQASIIAPLSGIAMGAVGSLRVAGVKGARPIISKLPAVDEFLQSLSTPTSSFWRSFITKGAIRSGEQWVELQAMNIAPAFVQNLAAAVSKDVPGVDWHFLENLKSPETAITALMFGLVGQGVASLDESKTVSQAIQSPRALMEAGIPEAKANEIATVDPAERESAFREAWQARTEESIAKGQKIAEQRIAREKAIAESPQMPRLEMFGNKFHIVEPDGTVSAKFDTPEAATQALQDRLTWEQNGTAQAVRDLVAHFAAKDPNRKFEINPNAQTLADEKSASPESVAEQMRLAGYQAGADPAKVKVFGSNVGEVREGIYTDVSRIHQGATPLDVIHERTHSQAKKELAEGTIKWSDAEKAVRAYLGDKAPEKLSEEAVHEGIANMGVDYFAGKFRQIESLPASVKGFFARIGAYFKDVFQRAAQMLKLKKEGKLAPDWEAFLARAVGLESVQHNRAMEETAVELAGGKVDPLANAPEIGNQASYSKWVTEGKKLPTEHPLGEGPRKIWAQLALGAKEVKDFTTKELEAAATVGRALPEHYNRTDMLRQISRELTQRSGVSFSIAPATYAEDLAKRFDALKKNPAARIEIYENAKRKLADLDRSQRFVLGVEKDKLGADKDQLSRVKMLQSFATLEAIASAMPPEVRAAIGGSSYARLAELKTSAARTKYIGDRIEKLDSALESHLQDEYHAKLDDLFEKTLPKQGDSKVRKSNLGPEAQESADFIRRVAGLSESELATEITAIEAKIDGETDPKKLSQLAQEWALANQFGDLDNQTAEQLSAAVDTFSKIVASGRNSWRVQEEARLADVQTKRQAVLDTLGKPQGVTASDLQKSKEKDRTFLAKAKAFIETNLSFAQTLQELFRNAKDKVSLHFEDSTRRATNDYADKINAAHDAFTKDVNRLLGVKSLRERHAKLAALSEAKDTGVDFIEGRVMKTERIDIDTARKLVSGGSTVGSFSLEELKTLGDMLAKNDAKPDNRKKKFLELERVAASGNPVPQRMSELEAVQYLLSWDQKDVRARMEKQGITQDAIDGLSKWISPDAMSLMGWLRDRYGEGYAKLNPTYQRMYGMNLPRVENYAPTFYDVAGRDAGEMSGPMDTTASKSGMAAGFIKSRTQHNAPIARVDALAAYWRHVVQSEYWRTWAEPVREMRGVLGNGEVLRAIRATSGAPAEEAVKGWLKTFETNGQKEAGMLRIAASLMQKVLASNSTIALGFKIGVLMKQASAALGSSMELPAGDAAAGWGRFLTGQLTASLPQIWHTDTIQRRVTGGFSPEVRNVMQANGQTPSMIGALAEKGLHIVGLTDAAFTTISASIAFDYHYREAIKSGMSEGEAQTVALDAMDRTVHRTAQPAEAADKSLNEISASVWAKMFMLFKSEARQKFAISYLAAKRMARGEEAGSNASRLFVTWVLANAITQTMGNAYHSVAGDKDPEEYWKWGDYLRAVTLGHLDGMFMVGPSLSAALSGLTGGQAFANKSQNPLDAVAAAITRKAFNPATWEDGAQAFEGAKLWMETLARVSGSEILTGAATTANAVKDFIGAGKHVSGN